MEWKRGRMVTSRCDGPFVLVFVLVLVLVLALALSDALKLATLARLLL